MASGPEKRFENKLRAALEELGAITRKLHGSQFQRDMPDLLIGHDGRTLMIEVKAGKPRADAVTPVELIHRMSPGQMYEAKQWTGRGCEYWIVMGDAVRDRAFAFRLRSGAKDVHAETITECARRLLLQRHTQASRP